MKFGIVSNNKNNFVYPLLNKQGVYVYNLFRFVSTNPFVNKILKFFNLLLLFFHFYNIVFDNWYIQLKKKEIKLIFMDEIYFNNVISKIILKFEGYTAIYLWNIFAKVVYKKYIIKLKRITFSFDKHDCNHYGFKYKECFIPFENKDAIQNKDFDVFFYGLDKGRANIINCFKERFSYLRLDFTVINEKDVYQTYPLSYEEYINRARRSECLFEVLQTGQHSETIRFIEAISLKNKLITNNQEVVKSPFYSNENFFLFEKIEDIDINALNVFLETPYVNVQKDFTYRNPLNWCKSFFLD